MKNSFMSNKKTWGIILSIIGFALITLIYFSPILEGKRIKQHDIEMYRGMSKELNDFRQETGTQSLWTNSMFGGMPAWNISVKQNSNMMNFVNKVLTFGFPHPIGAVFISMLGFFILLLVLDCGVLISFIGAIAYGFTSYLFIVIGAGHNSKAMAIAYMAPVIAGILLTYKGKYIWGALLTAIAMALEVRAGHLQITYYLALIVVFLVISELITDIRAKKMVHFLKASGLLVVAAILGVLTCSTTLYANYKYGQETMRGKPVLTKNAENQTNGLNRDYVTQWSYGIGETWSLMIPNAKGGASAYIGEKNPALDKADTRFRSTIAQQNAYWGDQPGTSGPVYVGAIVMFLFVLGLFVVDGKYKWPILAVTVLSILLSWGKNFMGFTDFFLDYIPGYSKFRAVSMTLVIAEVMIPILAFLALAKICKQPEWLKSHKKYLYISFGITGGICLLFSLMPSLFFNFLSQNEAQQFNSMAAGKDGALYQSLAEQLESVRKAIFTKDAIRSFIFILLAAIGITVYMNGKLKTTPLLIGLAVLIIIDMFPIDKRYLNNDNFISKRQYENPFVASNADKAILSDRSLDYRVLNLTTDIFNDASTSYFHKSIGGYHGAKLRRYQDVITDYLSPEIQSISSIFKNAQSNMDIMQGMQRLQVLNMLNTKYLIYSPEANPIQNPSAFGNAWIANNIAWVETANEEFEALGTNDLSSTAIINSEFKENLSGFSPADSIEGNITLTSYQPNELTYQFKSPSEALVVFSEIWTQDGWFMYVDGQEEPLLRANYLLRAALLPAGEHEIVMKYQPRIWKIGNTISFISSGILLVGLIAIILYSIKRAAAKKEV